MSLLILEGQHKMLRLGPTGNSRATLLAVPRLCGCYTIEIRGCRVPPFAEGAKSGAPIFWESPTVSSSRVFAAFSASLKTHYHVRMNSYSRNLQNIRGIGIVIALVVIALVVGWRKLFP